MGPKVKRFWLFSKFWCIFFVFSLKSSTNRWLSAIFEELIAGNGQRGDVNFAVWGVMVNGFAAGNQGRSGGQNVIDQEDAFPGQGLGMADGEDAFDVFPARFR